MIQLPKEYGIHVMLYFIIECITTVKEMKLIIIYTLKQKQQTPDIVEVESIPSESENEIAIEDPEELWRNSRIRNPPARLIEEISTVGAGVENQYNNTIELRPMKYEEASDDKVEWVKAVEKEFKISKNSTLQRQFS